MYTDADTTPVGQASSLYNPDFLLAATYQKAPASTRAIATDYCDVQWTWLDLDVSEETGADLLDTATLMTGGVAFDGTTKCTYFIATNTATAPTEENPDTQSAPAFTLTGTTYTTGNDFFDYELHYVEYMQVPGSGSFVPVNAGIYPDGANEYYPDPTYDIWTNGNTVNAPTGRSEDFTTIYPGSFQCSVAGMEYSTTYTESWNIITPLDPVPPCYEIMMKTKAYDEMITTFNAKVVIYDDEKALFEEAVASEVERIMDIFSTATATTLPIRPTAPWTPAEYSGPYLAYTGSAATIRASADTETDSLGEYTSSNPQKEALGWLTVASGTAGSESIAYTGHTYGLLGQGYAAMPNILGTNRAFNVGINSDSPAPIAQVQTIMMVSIFPMFEDMVGATTTDITLVAKAVPWSTFAELPISKPAAPTAAVISIVVGAVSLGLSVSAALVGLSLY